MQRKKEAMAVEIGAERARLTLIDIPVSGSCADRDVERTVAYMDSMGYPEYRPDLEYWRIVGKEPPADPYAEEPRGLERLAVEVTPLPRSRRRVLVAS
jgi:hypothetical protein